MEKISILLNKLKEFSEKLKEFSEKLKDFFEKLKVSPTWVGDSFGKTSKKKFEAYENATIFSVLAASVKRHGLVSLYTFEELDVDQF